MVTRSFNRAERVGGQVQKVLAGLIHNGVKDPRLARATITGVTMSRDLRIAKVYIAAHGGGQDEATLDEATLLAGFESAKGFIKRELAKELALRYMPELKFFFDGSFDYGAHINQVLRSIITNDEKNNPSSNEQ